MRIKTILFLLIFSGFETECQQICDKHLSREEALVDLNEFKNLIHDNSSYYRISEYDIDYDILSLEKYLKNQSKVSLCSFSDSLSRILGEMGDRHSSIRLESERFPEEYLPFAVAPYQDSLVLALRFNRDKKEYEFLLDSFQILTSINRTSIHEILELSDYRDKRAPQSARFTQRVKNLKDLPEVLHYTGLPYGKENSFTFSSIDKESDTTILMPRNYVKAISWWFPMNGKFIDDYRNQRNGAYDSLFQLTNSNVGIIAIPSMMDPEDDPNYFSLLHEKMNEFSNTKALVIDVRENGGGSRHLIDVFSKYFTNPDSKPWVANVAVARKRIDVSSKEITQRLNRRFLIAIDSNAWNDAEKNALKNFYTAFSSQRTFDSTLFGKPHAMVFTSGKTSPYYYYDKPVYILANERTFSAASILVACFKGFPGVTIAGVTTDGSSGLSIRNYLTNSRVRVKISTMLSFQRNGETLDTNGTKPDLELKRDRMQVLGQRDTQLESLLQRIGK
ncbi:S41 family peptidase [Ekhidna sp.]